MPNSQPDTSAMVRLTAMPRPLSPEVMDGYLPAGESLAWMVASAFGDEPGGGIAVQLNNRAVPAAEWGEVYPQPGDRVVMRVVAGDGGDVMRTVLTIAVVAAAAWAGPAGAAAMGFTEGTTAFAVASAAASAAAFTVGSMAVNAIAPPGPQGGMQTLAAGDSMKGSPTYSISSARNQLRPFGPVPFVIGRHRIVPDYAAKPYVSRRGQDQYLHLLFDLLGHNRISAIKVGDTPLNRFDDVEVEIKRGVSQAMTLYPSAVDEQQLAVALNQTDGWQQRRTANDTDYARITISFPRLIQYNDDGSKSARTVNFDVQWSVAGADDWQSGATATNTAAQQVACGNAPASIWVGDNEYIYYRYDRIGINKSSAVAKVFYGTVCRTASEALAAKPPIPATYWPAARILRTAGDTAITSGMITDERAASQITGFAVSALGTNSVAIATGTYYYDGLDTTAKSASRLLRDCTIRFPERGQYDIRIKRTTADSASDKIYDEAGWLWLQSFTNIDPIAESVYLTKVAVRIKATGQLNGIIDNLSFIAEQKISAWNSTTQAWEDRYTSDPAAWYRWLLQNEAASRQVADGEIDLTGLEDWAEDCAANGYTVNHVVDYEASTEELLSMVAACGRAAPGSPDGRFSVVLDRAQTAYAMHVSPVNMLGYKMHRDYLRCPHGFRVRFINQETWQWDERVVYDDGYDENNATRIEALELRGIIDPALIYKFGRFHIAAFRLRPETHYIDLDWRHLACRRGSLIDCTCSVIKVGLGTGWLNGVTDNTTHATAVTLDSSVVMESGKSYALRVQLFDGSRVMAPVDTVAGPTKTLTFTTPILLADAPQVDNHWSFGETGLVAIDLVVQQIEPGPDFNARIVAKAAAPEIHETDTGTIPDFVSQVSTPAHISDVLAPIIESVVSDESVLLDNPDGSYSPRIVVGLAGPAALADYPGLVDQIEVQYKLATTDADDLQIFVAPDAAEVSITNVAPGDVYAIRARYVSGTDMGPWAVAADHTVIGDTSDPADVLTLWAENNLVRWNYDPPRDFAGFEVRHRAGAVTSWDDAIKAHDGLLPKTVFDISELPGGVRTIMVKAVDRGGRQSANPAYVIKDLGDPVVDNIIHSTDYAAAGFPGTITNGTVTGGVLQADYEPVLFWPESGLFWPTDPTTLFWAGSPLEMSYQVTVVPEYDEAGSQMTIDHTVIGEPWSLDYRTDGDGVFWGADTELFWPESGLFWPSVADFRPWPGALDVSRKKYHIKATTGAGSVRGAISDFTVNIDVEDIVEKLSDITLSAAGTRLPITKSYRSIEYVNITLQDDGGDAVNVLQLDKNTIGPLLKGVDGSRTGVSATVDVTVGGY